MDVKFTKSFWKSLNRMVWLQRTYWLRPRTYKRIIKTFIQRGRRGWADEDVWNLHSYYSKVIAESMRHLKDNHMGVSSAIMGNPFNPPKRKLTIEEGDKIWCQIMEDIAVGFESYEKMIYDYELHPDSQAYKDLDAKWKKGHKLLIKHYGGFWD